MHLVNNSLTRLLPDILDYYSYHHLCLLDILAWANGSCIPKYLERTGMEMAELHHVAATFETSKPRSFTQGNFPCTMHELYQQHAKALSLLLTLCKSSSSLIIVGKKPVHWGKEDIRGKRRSALLFGHNQKMKFAVTYPSTWKKLISSTTGSHSVDFSWSAISHHVHTQDYMKPWASNSKSVERIWVKSPISQQKNIAFIFTYTFCLEMLSFPPYPTAEWNC